MVSKLLFSSNPLSPRIYQGDDDNDDNDDDDDDNDDDYGDDDDGDDDDDDDDDGDDNDNGDNIDEDDDDESFCQRWRQGRPLPALDGREVSLPLSSLSSTSST